MKTIPKMKMTPKMKTTQKIKTKQIMSNPQYKYNPKSDGLPQKLSFLLVKLPFKKWSHIAEVYVALRYYLATFLDGGQTWMEDNLGWETTLDVTQPWKEDNLPRMTFFNLGLQ